MGDLRLEGVKVLVVEDEYFIADDLSRALYAAGAKAVGLANTVEQANSLLAARPVDAAILDLNLRGEMAVEFVEQLSASGLPCIIVSGTVTARFRSRSVRSRASRSQSGTKASSPVSPDSSAGSPPPLRPFARELETEKSAGATGQCEQPPRL